MRLYELRPQRRPMVVRQIDEPLEDDINKVFAFLQEKAPLAWNCDIDIFRGIRKMPNGLLKYGDSSAIERSSTNTKNYYTILMDQIMPAWQGYPHRGRSFICTTVASCASSHVTPYQMYPIGDPVIGICPSRDLWESFKCMDLVYFENLFDACARYVKVEPDDDVATVRRVVSLMDWEWPSIVGTPEGRRFFRDLIGQYFYHAMQKADPADYASFSDFLAFILDPVDNGFKFKKLSQLTPADIDPTKQAHELWFAGPAYLLDLDALQVIRNSKA